MKLATLKDSTRDGTLIVVSRDLSRAHKADHIAPTLQAALDDWNYCGPLLEQLFNELNDSTPKYAFELDTTLLMAPLPRAYQWADASAFLNHIELVRKAFGQDMPPNYKRDPLMYQGGSDAMLGARDDLPVADESWGIDLEAELAVVTGDIPMGIERDKVAPHLRLFMLVNDLSLRNLMPAEFAKGFGFFNSKTWTSFSPVAVTADELGDAWDGKRLHLPMRVEVNGELLGNPDCGTDMQFHFGRLVEHAARTRPLGAGTIIGSGTISNRDGSRGSACLLEKRALETIAHGEARTPWLSFDDRVRIEILDAAGQSIFGAIDQKVVATARRGLREAEATVSEAASSPDPDTEAA